MSEVTVTCDRCKKQVEGIQTDIATGGFYQTGPDSMWHKFVHDEAEAIICDACMWASPEYQAVYGNVGQ